MNPGTVPRLAKWPFVVGDLLLVATAAVVVILSDWPIGGVQFTLAILGVALGAWLSVIPFLLEYRTGARLAESEKLVSTVGQIQRVQQVADQISVATAQWQTVQEQSAQTVATAREVSEHITTEAKAFAEFLRKANDTEKSHLRLEVEKLRRGEGDWVETLVRMLDHVYALHQAAARSGQPQLISQLDHFQNACRDAARRIGLIPFIGSVDEPFDAERHQVFEEGVEITGDTRIAETVASGYRFQGRILRQAVVRVQSSSPSDQEFSMSEIASRRGQSGAAEVDASAPAEQSRPPAPLEPAPEPGPSTGEDDPYLVRDEVPSEEEAPFEPPPGEALPDNPDSERDDERPGGAGGERLLF